MRPYAAAQLIGKEKNATPGMVIAPMAHGIEAANEAAVSTEPDATDILAEGSQFICEGDTDFVNRAFDIDCTGKSVWMPGVLSRKQQVAAPILAR